MYQSKHAYTNRCLFLLISFLVCRVASNNGETYVCYICEHSHGTTFCAKQDFQGAGVKTKSNCACCTLTIDRKFDEDLDANKDIVERGCVDHNETLAEKLCLPTTSKETCQGYKCNGTSPWIPVPWQHLVIIVMTSLLTSITTSLREWRHE